jgi:Na+/alanine symporter
MKKGQTKKQWLWEFSKKIVTVVTVIFVAVFFYTCILAWFYPDSQAVTTLAETSTRLFEVTVVSYAVKAGFENVHKIKKSGDREESIDE